MPDGPRPVDENRIMTNNSTPLPQGFPEVRGADFDYKQSVTQEYQHISNVRTERIFLREGLKDCQEGSRICTSSVCSSFFITLNSLSASS